MGSRIAVVTALAAIALTAGTPAFSQTTALLLDSQAGDFVGGGPPSRTLTPPTAAFSVTQSQNTISISVQGAAIEDRWSLRFSALDNGLLAAGTYSPARREPFSDPYVGLEISGMSGCNSVTGRFVVLEVEYAGGDVTRFAADFEQHCENQDAALFGSIRYNSTISDLVPFGGQYPLYQLTLGVPVHGRVSASGIDCGGGGLTCQLTFASVATVALTAIPDAGYLFGGWTEDCHGAAATSVRLNMRKHCAAVFLPTISTTPRTLLTWASSAGDYIGQGRSETYAPWNSRWAVVLEPTGQRLEIVVTSLDDAQVSRWNLWFQAPNGQLLQGGTNYTGAIRAPFNTTTPGLSVFGNGRGCNQVVGEFYLRELRLGPGDVVERVSLDFTHHCEFGAAPPLTGSLEYSRTGLPTMALDKTSLRFAGVVSSLKGLPILVATGPQLARLTQAGAGTVIWTATPSVPWLSVTPSSGTGSATVTISVSSSYPAVQVPPSGTATIAFSMVGAATTPGPISVSWTLGPTTLATPGTVDTPLDHVAGVTGSLPMTGWALDSIEVVGVSICRDAIPGEPVAVDARCGGARQVYVGEATFVEGARPDVEAAFSTFPGSRRAGWGLMILTNVLPNEGNGMFVFHAWARGRPVSALELGGLPRATLLGTRTITCANATATKPFGAIDTPEQGGVASGPAYVNFGWALTPLPKTIPTDGSTITVLIDGASVGNASYNHHRSDIASFFPGLNNSNGAIGFRVLDTTALTSGVHTISWTVVDDQGAIDGIGSRFFTVSNGASGVTSAVNARGSSAAVPAVRATLASRSAGTPLRGRRGWDLAAPLETFEPDEAGRIVVRSEEVSRIELHLDDGAHVGHLRTNDGLRALPIGSRIDPATGVFTWAPGVGFVGAYDLRFVSDVGTASERSREVRIILQPKGTHLTGPQVVIDAPRSQQDVPQPFLLGGWAADLNARSGTGIATVHAWAYPLTGGPPVFLGPTTYGGSRPDVAAVHGPQFEPAGFGLHVQGLTPGNYDLAVFAWSTLEAKFVNAAVVRATIR